MRRAKVVDTQSSARNLTLATIMRRANALGLSQGFASVAHREEGNAYSLPPSPRRIGPPICPDLIFDRHGCGREDQTSFERFLHLGSLPFKVTEQTRHAHPAPITPQGGRGRFAPQFAASRLDVACRSFFESNQRSLSAAAARLLDRRTRNRPVGAKHAAIAVPGFQSGAAASPVVEKLAGVRRHPLGRLVAAVRAADDGFQYHVDLHMEAVSPIVMVRR